MRYANILFPVDFSDHSTATAPFVRGIAAKNHAVVTLAHIVDTSAMWYAAAEAPWIPDFNTPQLITQAETRLAFFAGEHFSDVETRIVVTSGDPGSSLIEMSRTSGIDLVMMPTRGRGLFRTALLGSVTAKVLHDVECPVWTSAHPDTAHETPTEWKNVVCAVDTTDDALRLIRYAREIQAAYGSRINLVHAIPAPFETPGYSDREFQNFLEDSARESIGAMQGIAATEFPVCVRAGKISAVVASAARDFNADLALIGRGALPHVAGRLRTHVYAIIRDVPCPVLSI